jgi:sulfur-oxidizing protein SoxY
MKASSIKASGSNLVSGWSVRPVDAEPLRSGPNDIGVQRRSVLGAGALGLLVGCGLLTPRSAQAIEQTLNFDALSIPDALRAMKAVRATPQQLLLLAPEIAEDGALVSVSVESQLPDTRDIYLVVDVNPDPLAARFSVPVGTEPYIATRIKMAGDGVLYAVVRDQQGRVFTSFRPMKVTVGGCS